MRKVYKGMYSAVADNVTITDKIEVVSQMWLVAFQTLPFIVIEGKFLTDLNDFWNILWKSVRKCFIGQVYNFGIEEKE